MDIWVVSNEALTILALISLSAWVTPVVILTLLRWCYRTFHAAGFWRLHGYLGIILFLKYTNNDLYKRFEQKICQVEQFLFIKARFWYLGKSVFSLSIWNIIFYFMNIFLSVYSEPYTAWCTGNTDEEDRQGPCLPGHYFLNYFSLLKFYSLNLPSVQFSLSHVQLFATPWTTAHQASLSITNSWSRPKPMSIESVMPSNHLLLCHPLLLCPQSFPASGSFQMSQLFASGGQSIGVSASASVLPMNT